MSLMSRECLSVLLCLLVLVLSMTSVSFGQNSVTFGVGDCVEYDTTNAIDPAARWRRGRISKNDGYSFTIELEPRAGAGPDTTTVSVASSNRWLRPANGCTAGVKTAPPKQTQGAPINEDGRTGAGQCPFVKNYKKVSNGDPPSAELFKGVIFAWEYDLNKRFRDFGLTFPIFQMGRSFRNRVYPGINVRKDVDPAPVGAAIYPIKARMVTCQKDISITIRRVLEIQYNCYKDQFGTWVCKNNAPKVLEHTSFDNE